MLTEAALVTGATILGGLLRPLVDHWTGTGQRRQDELAGIRQQVMAELDRVNRTRDAEIQELRTEVVTLRREVDTWQSKYHDLRVELAVQRRENDRLEHELRRLQNRADAGPLEGPAVVSGGA